MITTNTMLSEKQNMQAMYNRRKIDIVYTQSVIQPLQSQYVPSNVLQIILQRSRHFISIGDIEVLFRPCVAYTSAAPFPTLAQKMMATVTMVNPGDCLAFSSATIEGNQIVSQPNVSLTRSRNLIQNYINQLQNVKKRDQMSPEHYDSGLIESAGNGSTNTGFAELSITHPYSNINVTGGEPANISRFEFDNYPRAIIDRSIAYNADFCVQLPGQATYPGCEYFASSVSVNADATLQTAIGAGDPTQAFVNLFPLLPLSITPSIAIYKAQQTRFAHFRQRFITATITPYYLPTTAANAYGVTNAINQAILQTAGGATVATTFAAQQKVIYGQPINGPFGGSAAGASGVPGVTVQGSSIAGITRCMGQMWTSASANFFPAEQFTNCAVKVSQTAIEFGPMGIQTLCMDSSQVILQYIINNPSSCLSANLQPSYFAPTLTNATQIPPYGQLPIVAGNGGTSAQYQQFLNCCVLSNVELTLTDVCCKIIYQSYQNEEAYSLCRQLTYQGQAFFSFRQQIDNIIGNGQQFSRLSIGGSSLIAGVWLFMVPAQSAGAGAKNNSSKTNSSDCIVNYFGANPLNISDLRGNQAWDSYYPNMSDVYVQVNNKRYTVNALPISNPALSTYLYTQSGLETAMGKYLNIPLTHYLANRWCCFIPINPFGDRSEIITDNQLIVSASFDFTARSANSKMYGESNTDCSNQFALLSVCQTMQTLVDASYIKIN